MVEGMSSPSPGLTLKTHLFIVGWLVEPGTFAFFAASFRPVIQLKLGLCFLVALLLAS